MIIFLYGEDVYRSRKKLEAVTARYQKLYPASFRMHEWDSSSASLGEIREAWSTRSMFREKIFLLLRNVLGNLQVAEYVQEQKKSFVNDDNIIAVFFEERALPARHSFASFLLKNAALAQEFSFLPAPQLKAWVSKETTRYGVQLSPTAQRFLLNEVGNDLWRMQEEIRKIAAFAVFSKDRQIEEVDVRSLVASSVQTDMFRTLDALVAKNKALVLELFAGHQKKGDSPFYLLSMVLYQFRQLLLVKDLQEKGKNAGEIQRALKMHPFVFQKIARAAQQFSLQEASNLFLALCTIDRNVKLGKDELSRALDFFALQISN